MLFFLALLCLCTSAAGTAVYVDAERGDDMASGGADAPYKTLQRAVSSFAGTDGGEIFLRTDVALADGEELYCRCDGRITVTSGGGALLLGEKTYINAPVTFRDLTMRFAADVPMLFCEGNSVTFGEGLVTSFVTYAPIVYGGTWGGKAGVTQKKMCFSDYTVTVQSGTWYYVRGGSFRDGEGQPVGTLSNVTLEITGGVFTSKKTGAADNAVISPTGFDALLGDAHLRISGGKFSAAIVGIARPGYNATVSNNQYAKGNVFIEISGGDFTGGGIRAVQDSVASSIAGDFFAEVSGGSFSNFAGVNGTGVTGLAVADVLDGILLQNIRSVTHLHAGESATVTNGGLVRIHGCVDSTALRISGDKKVIIEGADAEASLEIADVLYVGGDTVIRNLVLNGGGSGIISCSDGKIRIEEGIGGNVYALEYSGSRGAVHVFTDGYGGKVGVAKYPTADCADVFGAVAPPSATVSLAGCTEYVMHTDAVFVRDGGDGDGSSPSAALGDLAEAVRAANGKTVVVCGPVRLLSTLTLPKTEGKTVITSQYMGLDYRDFSDACIELSAGLRLAGETVFENVDFVAFERETFLSAEGNPLTVGEGVNCRLFTGKRVEKYPLLVGGSYDLLRKVECAHLTVKSGTFSVLSGGSYFSSDTAKSYAVNGDVTVEIFGGTFHDGIYLAGRSAVGGDATLSLADGIADCSVYATGADGAIFGKAEIGIYGGAVHGDIIGGAGKAFALRLVGGDLTRTSRIDVGGTLYLADTVDLTAEITGVAEYKNPVASSADQAVIFHEGWYYYSYAKTYLGKPALWMEKAANVTDLGNTTPVLVWAAALCEGGDEILSLWAPQLYNIDGGWYLYATCDMGSRGANGTARRMPVIWRAMTEDPIGEYEYCGRMRNTDETVFSYLSPRLFAYGGKLYMFCGGFYREEDCTGQHIQRLFGCELSDPLTMGSTAAVISSPMYAYENGIMEGPFPFYSPNGTLYMLFAAGHTRTDTYCTGLLRFTGGTSDSLLDASKWTKDAEPLHEVSYENGVYSPGAMIVTHAPNGEYLAIYHAKEYHYSAYTMRRLYIQRMTFENDRPHVEAPQPTDTVFSLPLNGMPLAERITGILRQETATGAAPTRGDGEVRLLARADLNGDGKVSLLDVLRILRMTVRENTLFGDLDCDGQQSIRDVLLLLRQIVG